MRTETEIMTDILGVYNDLSPENIEWDGERPKREVERDRARLNKRLKALFAEIGREVDEDGVYAFLEKKAGMGGSQ